MSCKINACLLIVWFFCYSSLLFLLTPVNLTSCSRDLMLRLCYFSLSLFIDHFCTVCFSPVFYVFSPSFRGTTFWANSGNFLSVYFSMLAMVVVMVSVFVLTKVRFYRLGIVPAPSRFLRLLFWPLCLASSSMKSSDFESYDFKALRSQFLALCLHGQWDDG